MIKKTISIPDNMREWIHERISQAQYNNESEYFRDLIREDQSRQNSITKLRQVLLQSEKSGISNQSVLDIMKSTESKLQHNGQISSSV